MAFGAAAWATTRNTVRISAPRTVNAGARVRLRFTGHARTARRLLVLLDNHRCAGRERAESRRPNTRSPVRFPVHGAFRTEIKIRHSVRGTHFVCAYLVRRYTDRTLARATHRYVTR